jgi:ATP-dependent helicase/nuclease subunit A
MSILQIKASDPELSTWVSASAGTGKTKILTDRVLRLLLQGVPFNKILCLTFTNSAANEMQERIISHLEKWSHSEMQDLSQSLANTLGRKASKDEVIKASYLFKSYLKTQDQINIYTVHSFCQKILKKFPLEAGISPNFKIIDEFKVKQIITDIKRQIFNLPDIEPITRFFVENFHELTIDDIFNDIISIKTRILEKKLNLSEISSDMLLSGLEYLEALSTHDPNIYADIITNTEIRSFVTKLHDNKPLSAINLKSFFLTSQDEKKKRIVTKKIANPDSDFYKELEILQEEIYQIDQSKKTDYLILYSKLLVILAEKFIYQFETHKKKNTFLDYDDLIIYTQNLLTNSYAKEWVLYKLDGGIEHLLVDEAQDTSKSQWSIIEALVEEFYVGESNNCENRTIFVVGDEKQSIFSFQGADISSFSYMNKFLNKKLTDGKKAFNNIDLNVSYRSTKEILSCVHDVFHKIAKNNPEDFSAKLQNMMAHREEHNGLVELWPLCLDKNDETSDEFWPLLYKNNLNSGKIILAEKIANYVKEQIDSGKILPSTNKRISAQDFMIIFRTRDDFTDEVIKSLRKAEIDITGLDRISLAEDLAIADIISILNFVLNTDNDLNLASLLKSPIISISEKELYTILIEAKKNNMSIWAYLNFETQYFVAKNRLEEFLDLYKNLPLSSFFLYITDVLNYRNFVTNNDEVIDEFLKLVKNYLSEYGSSLQNFIYWFQSNQITIKKDTDAKDKLRIMTAHASKGLQAPIVILCDTTKLPTSTERFIWDEKGQILSAKSSSYVPEFYKTLKTKEQKKTYQEYLRLLYVAMTRAEDNLIICGYQGRNNLSDGCWYQLVKNSIEQIGSHDSHNNLIYGDPNASLMAENFLHENEDKEIIMNEILKPVKTWELKESFYKCAANIKDEISYNKSLSLEYGIVFHKILEDVVRSKSLYNVNNHPLIKTLDANLQKKIKNSLEKLVSNNQFQELLKYTLKTEVSFGYKIKSDIKIGRVDLLVIQEDQIIIIDYKSGNKPNINLIPDQYVDQLKRYKETFTEIYPDKNISCKIIWLEHGVIQDIVV